MKELKRQFENTAELYRIELCKMFEIQYGDTYWIGEEVGGVLDIQQGWLSLSYDDVRFIVDNRLPLDEVEKWSGYNSAVYLIKDGLNSINLRSWHNGCPHVDAEAWDKQLTVLQMGNKMNR